VSNTPRASRIEDDLKARALWFTAPRTAESRQETVPSPGPGEVRVETVASAVSAGTEMFVYRGEVPQDLGLDLPTLAGLRIPHQTGYSAAGYVLDTGPDVDHLSAGDTVFTHHPRQDVFLVSARMPVRLRDDLDPVLGVFSANFETALTVVHDTPVRLGETVLIFGEPMLRVRMSAAATRRASRLLRWEHRFTGFEQVLKTVAETGKSGRR
jgi:NADPH:quinone reductase-like Zn-dependent oxidoreductase